MSEYHPYKQGKYQNSSRSTDDPSSGKTTHESKATKRIRRGDISGSCLPCRRRKISCDKLHDAPCSRCVKKGLLCSNMNGTIPPGQGNLLIRILATEQLHSKFAKSEARMHASDGALATAQTIHILPPHPLLSLREDEDDTDDVQKLRSISEQPEKETNAHLDGRIPQSRVQLLDDSSVCAPKEYPIARTVISNTIAEINSGNINNNQLFSNSKNFSIGNGATFTVASGDVHQNTTNDHSSNTTIYNNCTFARETGSPTKSSPPPSHRSKRSPDHQKQRRWSITTFVHTVYHHYLQPVIVYPIAWAVPAWTMPLSWVNFLGGDS